MVNTSQLWRGFLEHSAFNLQSFERWDASQMEIGVENIQTNCDTKAYISLRTTEHL